MINCKIRITQLQLSLHKSAFPQIMESNDTQNHMSMVFHKQVNWEHQLNTATEECFVTQVSNYLLI